MCDSGLYSKGVFSVDTIHSIIMTMMIKTIMMKMTMKKAKKTKKKAKLEEAEETFFEVWLVCNFRYEKMLIL